MLLIKTVQLIRDLLPESLEHLFLFYPIKLLELSEDPKFALDKPPG